MHVVEFQAGISTVYNGAGKIMSKQAPTAEVCATARTLGHT